MLHELLSTRLKKVENPCTSVEQWEAGFEEISNCKSEDQMVLDTIVCALNALGKSGVGIE